MKSISGSRGARLYIYTTKRSADVVKTDFVNDKRKEDLPKEKVLKDSERGSEVTKHKQQCLDESPCCSKKLKFHNSSNLLHFINAAEDGTEKLRILSL